MVNIYLAAYYNKNFVFTDDKGKLDTQKSYEALEKVFDSKSVKVLLNKDLLLATSLKTEARALFLKNSINKLLNMDNALSLATLAKNDVLSTLALFDERLNEGFFDIYEKLSQSPAFLNIKEVQVFENEKLAKLLASNDSSYIVQKYFEEKSINDKLNALLSKLLGSKDATNIANEHLRLDLLNSIDQNEKVLKLASLAFNDAYSYANAVFYYGLDSKEAKNASLALKSFDAKSFNEAKSKENKAEERLEKSLADANIKSDDKDTLSDEKNELSQIEEKIKASENALIKAEAWVFESKTIKNYLASFKKLAEQKKIDLSKDELLNVLLKLEPKLKDSLLKMDKMQEHFDLYKYAAAVFYRAYHDPNSHKAGISPIMSDAPSGDVADLAKWPLLYSFFAKAINALNQEGGKNELKIGEKDYTHLSASMAKSVLSFLINAVSGNVDGINLSYQDDYDVTWPLSVDELDGVLQSQSKIININNKTYTLDGLKKELSSLAREKITTDAKLKGLDAMSKAKDLASLQATYKKELMKSELELLNAKKDLSKAKADFVVAKAKLASQEVKLSMDEYAKEKEDIVKAMKEGKIIVAHLYEDASLPSTHAGGNHYDDPDDTSDDPYIIPASKYVYFPLPGSEFIIAQELFPEDAKLIKDAKDVELKSVLGQYYLINAKTKKPLIAVKDDSTQEEGDVNASSPGTRVFILDKNKPVDVRWQMKTIPNYIKDVLKNQFYSPIKEENSVISPDSKLWYDMHFYKANGDHVMAQLKSGLSMIFSPQKQNFAFLYDENGKLSYVFVPKDTNKVDFSDDKADYLPTPFEVLNDDISYKDEIMINDSVGANDGGVPHLSIMKDGELISLSLSTDELFSGILSTTMKDGQLVFGQGLLSLPDGSLKLIPNKLADGSSIEVLAPLPKKGISYKLSLVDFALLQEYNGKWLKVNDAIIKIIGNDGKSVSTYYSNGENEAVTSSLELPMLVNGEIAKASINGLDYSYKAKDLNGFILLSIDQDGNPSVKEDGVLVSDGVLVVSKEEVYGTSTLRLHDFATELELVLNTKDGLLAMHTLDGKPISKASLDLSGISSFLTTVEVSMDNANISEILGGGSMDFITLEKGAGFANNALVDSAVDNISFKDELLSFKNVDDFNKIQASVISVGKNQILEIKDASKIVELDLTGHGQLSDNQHISLESTSSLKLFHCGSNQNYFESFKNAGILELFYDVNPASFTLSTADGLGKDIVHLAAGDGSITEVDNADFSVDIFDFAGTEVLGSMSGINALSVNGTSIYMSVQNAKISYFTDASGSTALDYVDDIQALIEASCKLLASKGVLNGVYTFDGSSMWEDNYMISLGGAPSSDDVILKFGSWSNEGSLDASLNSGIAL